MKAILLTIGISFLSLTLHAQDNTKQTQYSIGYFGNFAADHGAKIGAHFYLNKWIESYQLYLNPQASFFSKPLFHRTFMGNVDLGWRRQNPDKKIYHAAAIGVGWMARQEVLSFRTDFRGDIRAKSYENWYYFVPTISFEFGKEVVPSLGWYAKVNYGPKIPLTEGLETAGFFLFEGGIKFPLKINNEVR